MVAVGRHLKGSLSYEYENRMVAVAGSSAKCTLPCIRFRLAIALSELGMSRERPDIPSHSPGNHAPAPISTPPGARPARLKRRIHNVHSVPLAVVLP